MVYASGAPRDPTAVVGRRITAYVIDGLLVLLGVVVVLSLVKHDTFRDAPADACSILRARAADSSRVLCVRVASRAWLWKRDDFLIAAYAAAAIGILNLVVLQAFTGASLGKHALGLRVVDEQGRTAGFGRTIARSLLLVVDGGIFLIGLIAVLSTQFHRRLGDLAAGTYVVGNAGAGSPVGIAPMPVPYGGPVFAPPGAGPVAAPTVAFAEAPAPMAPGWGMQPPPPAAPPAVGSSWSSPPGAPTPGAPPAPTSTAPAPAPVPSPSPLPSVPAPPPPTPRTPPAPAPAAPVPGQWSPPSAPAPPPPPSPAPAPAPARPSISQPGPQPPPERKLEPESWWDTAIPAEPADGEEQS